MSVPRQRLGGSRLRQPRGLGRSVRPSRSMVRMSLETRLPSGPLGLSHVFSWAHLSGLLNTGSGGGGAAVPLRRVCPPAAGLSPSADPVLRPLRPCPSARRAAPAAVPCPNGAGSEAPGPGLAVADPVGRQRWGPGAGGDSPPPPARFRSCSTAFPDGSARPVLAQAHVERVEKALTKSVMETLLTSD